VHPTKALIPLGPQAILKVTGISTPERCLRKRDDVRAGTGGLRHDSVDILQRSDIVT
jgi:hypothetical protein